jgi:hypothetical protein
MRIQVVLSSEPEAICLPSCETATEVTQSECPLNGPATISPVPVSASQVRIVLSLDPETIFLLSCKNATEVSQSVCPSNGPATISPVLASQTQIVRSFDPETTCLLSCENATEATSASSLNGLITQSLCVSVSAGPSARSGVRNPNTPTTAMEATRRGGYRWIADSRVSTRYSGFDPS